MRKKRFLLVASYADSILSFRGKLIDALIAKGLEVYVTAPLIKDTDIEAELCKKGAQVFEIALSNNSTHILKDLHYCFSLYKLMLKIRPHYMLAYTMKPVIYGGLISWLSFIPKRYVMITGLGYLFHEENRKTFLTQFVYTMLRCALASTTSVFFQNNDNPRLLQQMSLLSHHKPTVVLNGSGVDLEHYFFSAPPVRVRFLMVARFLKSKGLYEYVEAAKQLKIRYTHVEFALAGWCDEGPDAVSISDIEPWIVCGDIQYLGKLADVRPEIKNCSVFVLPSYQEGRPRSVLEAMSMGRAIITTDAPGCREAIVHEQNGLLVKPKCVTSLANAMERFILEKHLSTKMGNESRALAEKWYDVHVVNQKMLETMSI